MNKIVDKEYLPENVIRLEVEAPSISSACCVGDFVVVCVGNKNERIPLQIISFDESKGTIMFLVKVKQKYSNMLCQLNTGDSVFDISIPKKEVKVEYDWGSIVSTLVVLFFVFIIGYIILSFSTSTRSDLRIYVWIFDFPAIIVMMILISFFAKKRTGYRRFFMWTGWGSLILYLVAFLPILFFLAMMSPPYR